MHLLPGLHDWDIRRHRIMTAILNNPVLVAFIVKKKLFVPDLRHVGLLLAVCDIMHIYIK